MFVDPSADPSAVQAAQDGDALRPLRMFVGALLGANDQTYAGQDAYAVSYPNQGLVYSPGYGVGVDGKPIAVTNAGGLVISPTLVLVGLGVALALMWKH